MAEAQIYQALGPTTPSPYPKTTAELVTVLAHFHRAEIARMAGWRDRIDRTSNWAITTVAAVLSVSLSAPRAPHGLLLFAMLLTLLFLVIEARRYRFFDVFRNRVRRLEHYYFAQIFAPAPDASEAWLRQLGDELRGPLFLTSQSQAISMRLRRNYAWLFGVLALAWIIETVSIRTPEPSNGDTYVVSLRGWALNAAMGPLSGWVVISAVGCFYAWVIYATATKRTRSNALTSGRVHV